VPASPLGLRRACGVGLVALALACCSRGQARSDSTRSDTTGAPAAAPTPPAAVAAEPPGRPDAVLLAEADPGAHPAPLVPAPGEMRDSVAPLVDDVKASVVTILTSKTIQRVLREDPWSQLLREQFGMGGGPRVSQERSQSLGSGFLLDRSGLVLTNNHVVAGAEEVIVKLADNRQIPSRVLGSDPATDVAVVKMDVYPDGLNPVRLGDSNKVRVGDYVLAIGNPLGLGQTVTMGIVSAKNRSIGEKLGDLDPRYQDFIQTDAAINQGNSGGPLFNFRGEVIGINSAILNPGVAMNVGFAIPINLARQISDQIRATGRVARGYLGVGGEDFTPERARELRVPFAAGALVNLVGRGSPAEAAGLRPNDVIVAIGGQTIDGFRRLPIAVATLRPGDKARVSFVREGRRMEAEVTIGGQASDLGGAHLFLGIDVREVEPRVASALGLASGQGLAVTAVDPRGPASGVLEEGDVLLFLDRDAVTLANLRALEARLSQGAHAILIVQRGGSRFAIRM
jgi:serine protease Do